MSLLASCRSLRSSVFSSICDTPSRALRYNTHLNALQWPWHPAKTKMVCAVLAPLDPCHLQGAAAFPSESPPGAPLAGSEKGLCAQLCPSHGSMRGAVTDSVSGSDRARKRAGTNRTGGNHYPRMAVGLALSGPTISRTLNRIGRTVSSISRTLNRSSCAVSSISRTVSSISRTLNRIDRTLNSLSRTLTCISRTLYQH